MRTAERSDSRAGTCRPVAMVWPGGQACAFGASAAQRKQWWVMPESGAVIVRAATW